MYIYIYIYIMLLIKTQDLNICQNYKISQETIKFKVFALLYIN